jgi:hypothetical protein
LASCGSSNERESYYLYRGSVVGSDRIYIAKFDAPEGRAYDEENCVIVRGLIERQPGGDGRILVHSIEALAACLMPLSRLSQGPLWVESGPSLKDRNGPLTIG